MFLLHIVTYYKKNNFSFVLVLMIINPFKMILFFKGNLILL